MKLKTYISLFAFALLFSSCVSDVVIPFEDDNKLYVEADLSRSTRIEAKLSTVTNFSDVTNVFRPEDAKIRLLSGIDIELQFEYDPIDKVYFIPRTKHIIQPSWNYRLTAQLSDEDENVMTASTSIPPLVKFGVESGAIVNQTADNNGVQIKLDLPDKGFFRVKAYRVKKEVKNNSVTTLPGEHMTMKFFEGEGDNLAYHEEMHSYGVLVDVSRLDEVILTYADESIDSKLADQYLVEIQHLSEASYRYHLSKSKQISAIEKGVATDPVINYTNIEGGFGVLGAFSSFRDTISVR